MRERWIERDGAKLRCLELGDGPPVLLLHGLAGYAGEWSQTASWLGRDRRLLIPDQRGHGRSERRPNDLARAAFVADAAAWLEQLAGAPAAGTRPCCSRRGGRSSCGRSWVAEASPEADPGAPAQVREWLERWPVPFASRAAALRFFGGRSLWARTWAGGLERRDDGLRPQFDVDVMVAALAEVARRSYWDDWSRLACPALIVRAARDEGAATAARMRRLLPAAALVEIAGAGHDVHLDRPRAWRAAIERWLPVQD
jgi:pimeloyl-ACP methyl ester carboxylesterase